MMNKINLDENIFIAGGYGMVGSAIYRKLESFKYGIKGKILRPSKKTLDLLDKNQVDVWFKKNKPTVVIVAAARVGGIIANDTYPFDFIFENLRIQTNIIDASWRNGVKRLLFLGSSCIYPKLCSQPIKEEYLLTGPLETTNEWYAVSKIAGLKLCQAIRKQHNFDAICLMPTNLYGPGDNYIYGRSHVIPSLIRRFWDAKQTNQTVVTCWGTGKALREFLYIDDLAEACITALEKWDPNDEYAPSANNGDKLTWLNIGSNQEVSIKDLANKISKEIGFQGEIIWDYSKPDGTPRKLLDSSKSSLIGWRAKTSLELGLKKTINYFEQEIKSGTIRS